tara:strand:- start:86 stop:310 length:225 start_codon:yes stop_codon:yes gene_type:complete
MKPHTRTAQTAEMFRPRLDEQRNPVKGALGDALHVVLCGAGHNIRLLCPFAVIVLAWLGRSASDCRCQIALVAA